MVGEFADGRLTLPTQESDPVMKIFALRSLQVIAVAFAVAGFSTLRLSEVGMSFQQ